MHLEYTLTGILGSVEIKKAGTGKVANFEIAVGGSYNPDTKKYSSHFYPLEAWLEDQIEKLSKANKGDILTVRYRPYPRTVDMGDFKRKIIVWKANEIVNWNSKKGGYKEHVEQPVIQLTMEEISK